MQNPQPRSITALPELDNIVEAYRYPTTSTSAVPTEGTSSDLNIPSEDDFDLHHEDNYDNTSPSRGLRGKVTNSNGLIINISHGPHSSTAASTNLFYHLIALTTLSRQHGGKHNTAIYIDCTNSFSATQLYKATISCTRTATTDNLPPSIPHTAAAKEALNHVHVLRCTSTYSLLSQLQKLPTYLLEPSAHRSFDRSVGLLVVDGINHFYRQDRFDAEIARLEGVNTSGLAASSIPLSAQILSELKKMQETYGCTIIYTTIATTPPVTSTTIPGTGPRADGTSPTPAPAPNESAIMDFYARNALVNLHPTKVGVSQFAPTMSLEECLRDKDARAEAVRMTRYWVGASAGGLSNNQGESGAGQNRRGFTMQIAKDGVIGFG